MIVVKTDCFCQRSEQCDVVAKNFAATVFNYMSILYQFSLKDYSKKLINL